MGKAFLIFLVTACVAGGPIAGGERARHKAQMDAAQDLRDEILEDLEMKSSAKIVEPAVKLTKFAEQEIVFWNKANIAAGVKIASENLQASKILEAAAKAGQFSQATAAFAKLNETCASCHDLHLEKRLKTS